MIFLISCRLRQTKVWRKDSGRTAEKLVEKRLKKFLTNVNEYDNLNKLFQTAKTKNLDNYTIDNNPENSKENYSEQTFNVEP